MRDDTQCWASKSILSLSQTGTTGISIGPHKVGLGEWAVQGRTQGSGGGGAMAYAEVVVLHNRNFNRPSQSRAG